MVLTAAVCFAAHYYMMGMINEGFQPSPGAFRDAKFVLPAMDEVQDPQVRSAFERVQGIVAPIIEPVLPLGEYLMNWKTSYLWDNRSIYFDDRIEVDPATQTRRVVAGPSHNVPPMWYRIQTSFTSGNFNNSFTIWTMLSLVFWTLVGTVVRSGPIGAVFQTLAQPLRYAKMFFQRHPKDWGALLIGAGLGSLGVSGLNLAPEASLTAALGGALIAPTMLGNRLANLIFALIPGPWKGRRSQKRFSLRSARLLIMGLPAGAGLTFGFGHLGVLAWGLLAAGIALVFLPRIRRWVARLGVRGTVVLSLAAAWWLGLFDCWDVLVWADDGGKAELSNATLSEWMASDGGIEVAIHSATGTLGTALGPLASGIQGDNPLPEEVEQKNRLTELTITVGQAVYE